MVASEPPTELTRSFIAVELAEWWRGPLLAAQRALEAAVPGQMRWVAPEQMHLTLAFLGAIPPETLVAARLAAEEALAGASPLTLRLGRAGGFGPPSSLRVVWVDIQGEVERLARLQRRLTAALAARAVPFDAKPFVPHITLGRARRDASAVGSRALYAALQRLPPLAGAPYRVETITLFKSELRPGGPRYTPLAHLPLLGAGESPP